MRVALIITDQDFYSGTGFAEAWTQALQAEGCTVERLAGIPAEWARSGPPPYDLAIPHVLVEEVAAFAPTLQVAALLEGCGVPLVNPVRSLLTSSDKLVTHAVWAAAGLPQPASWDLTAVDAWPAPGRPLVLKPSLCDGARHISLVRDLAEAHAVVARWRADEATGGERRGTAVLQEWIEDPACVRVFATPTDVSLAYEKSREPGRLITHGTVYPRTYPAPPAMADLARRMVAALGGGLMGVDVLVRPDGGLVALEANAPFGFDVTDPEQCRWVARSALAAVRERAAAAA